MSTGCITITSYPENAMIYIDNMLVIDENEMPILTPASLILNEGIHDVMLVLEGYCNEYDIVYILSNGDSRLHKTFNIC